jgi:hypothetical protein
MNSRMLAVGAVVLILLLGGLGLAFYNSKMNTEIERLVRFSVDGMSEAGRIEWVEEWSRLSDDETILVNVVKEKKLVTAWGSEDEATAVKELLQRKSIVLSPDGKSMHVAIKGIRKEIDLLNSTSAALFEEVREKFVEIHPEFAPHLQP